METGRLTSSQCQNPLWVGASGSKQVTTKPLVSSGKPDQRRCGEWSDSPPAIGATKLLSISSPSVTSSLSSVNEGCGGSRSYGSGACGRSSDMRGRYPEARAWLHGVILTQRRLNRTLLARQGLLERRELSIPDALDAMGTLQAQYAPSMYIGLWSRVAGLRARRADPRARAARGGSGHADAAHDPPRLARRLLAAGATRSRDARRAHWLRVSKGHDLTAEAETLAAALRDGPLKRKEIEDLIGREALRGINSYLDLLRVPPSGTWERRRADLFALAEAYIDQSDRRGRGTSSAAT